MPKAKHTPGPWSIDWHQCFKKASVNGALIHTESGVRIARITRVADKDSIQKQLDARLIAAAPEMLEALIEVEQMIHAGEMNEGTMSLIRAVITKATVYT